MKALQELIDEAKHHQATELATKLREAFHLGYAVGARDMRNRARETVEDPLAVEQVLAAYAALRGTNDRW